MVKESELLAKARADQERLASIQGEIEVLNRQKEALRPVAEGFWQRKAELRREYQEREAALDVEYQATVGREYDRLYNRIAGLSHQAYDLSNKLTAAQKRPDWRRAVNITNEEQRIKSLTEMAGQAKLRLIETSEGLMEEDGIAAVLGSVARKVLTDPTISPYLPLLIEQDLEHYPQRGNSERVLIGERHNGARLLFFSDGSLGFTLQPRFIAGVNDGEEFKPVVGFVTTQEGLMSFRVSESGPVPMPANEPLFGVISDASKILQTGSVSVKVAAGTITSNPAFSLSQ